MLSSEQHKSRQKIVRLFLIRAAIAYISWLILYYGFIQPEGTVNYVLTNLVIKVTVLGLELLGYQTSGLGDMILIDGQPVVLVADACNGLELIALFVGFIVCFPGRVVYKSVFIVIGSFVIFLINILREIVLSLNYKYFQETFDFNHKYTYVFVVYVFVFFMWRIWLKKYSVLHDV
jgi:exosortase/archaeosortase family protein